MSITNRGWSKPAIVACAVAVVVGQILVGGVGARRALALTPGNDFLTKPHLIGGLTNAANNPYDFHSVASGDFNGDGNQDVAANVEDAVGVFFGDGQGNLTTSILPVGGEVQAVAVGDVNGDGNLDVVAAIGLGGESAVVVLSGDGHGGFGPVNGSPGHYVYGQGYGIANWAPDLAPPADPHFCTNGCRPTSVALGDLNGDTHPDVVVTWADPDQHHAPPNGGTAVLMNNGDGTLTETADYLSGDTHPQQAAIADFNRDGFPDIAVVDLGVTPTAGYSEPSDLEIFTGDGTGAMTPGSAYTFDPYWATSVTASDVNGDGNPDLFVGLCCGGTPTGGVAAMYGNGDATFSYTPSRDFYPGWQDQVGNINGPQGGVNKFGVAIADVNHDGLPDVISSGDSRRVRQSRQRRRDLRWERLLQLLEHRCRGHGNHDRRPEQRRPSRHRHRQWQHLPSQRIATRLAARAQHPARPRPGRDRLRQPQLQPAGPRHDVGPAPHRTPGCRARGRRLAADLCR
jgi:hypothetical protein